MRAECEAELGRLVGARLTQLARAADMQLVDFVAPDGIDFHLHLQCAWRLRNGSEILVGRPDYFVAADASVDIDADIAHQHDPVGSRWRDVRNAAVNAALSAESTVTSLTVDDVGGFGLGLASGWCLEVFPCASPAPHDEYGEEWRLLRSEAEDNRHFVVTSNGIQRAEA